MGKSFIDLNSVGMLYFSFSPAQLLDIFSFRWKSIVLWNVCALKYSIWTHINIASVFRSLRFIDHMALSMPRHVLHEQRFACVNCINAATLSHPRKTSKNNAFSHRSKVVRVKNAQRCSDMHWVMGNQHEIQTSQPKRCWPDWVVTRH